MKVNVLQFAYQNSFGLSAAKFTANASALKFGGISDIKQLWHSLSKDREKSGDYNQSEKELIAMVRETLGHDELFLILLGSSPWVEDAFIVSGEDAAHFKNRMTLWQKLREKGGLYPKQFAEQARQMLSSIVMFLLYNSRPKKDNNYEKDVYFIDKIDVFTATRFGDKEC